MFPILRYEYKYYVPNNKLNLLRSMIIPFMNLDEFADSRRNKEYTVRSIYFDTPTFECYSTKIDGLKHRNKVRIRGYNEESPDNKVFLEIKRKYEGPIMKNRAALKYRDLKRIFMGESPDMFFGKGKSNSKQEESANRFFYQLHSRKMRPVVDVIYEREPYLSKVENPINNLRITLDKNLRGTPYPTIDDLYSEKKVRYATPGYFILEVKFNQNYPVWMNPIISILGLSKESASKYCICVDLHDSVKRGSSIETLHRGRFLRDK